VVNHSAETLVSTCLFTLVSDERYLIYSTGGGSANSRVTFWFMTLIPCTTFPTSSKLGSAYYTRSPTYPPGETWVYQWLCRPIPVHEVLASDAPFVYMHGDTYTFNHTTLQGGDDRTVNDIHISLNCSLIKFSRF